MPVTKLLYRIVSHNCGVVFATEERALYIAEINRALRTARTWGEFRDLMPVKEYEEIVGRMEFENEEQMEPDPDEEFSGEWFTEEGDYPDWLQSEMNFVIPHDILELYGERKDTLLNGSYWHISKENMEPMAEALRARGYIVEAAQELAFH
jgi:hypothetical protein